MQIIVDTREQESTRYFKTCLKAKLDVGDYTTKKLKNRFHIERKALGDLYGTLVQGNSRFKRELFRAAYHQVKLEIFIEGTYEQFINKEFPKGNERKCPPEKLIALIKTFTKVYYCQFVWHKNRQACVKAVQARLEYMEKALK